VRFDGSADYPEARGYSKRTTIVAGNSIGATSGTAEWVFCHEIDPAGNTPACAPLDPGTNFTGAKTTSHAVLFARGGQLQGSVPSFTAPAGDVFITGLQSGSWNISGAATATVTVNDGDNSLYFQSAAGLVSIVRSGAGCSITTGALPGGTVGTAYSQTLQSANCTAPLAWSLSAGSLCAGLSLNPSSGTISGVPSAAGTCTFTVQVTDGTASSATQPLSITVAPPVVTPVSAAASVSGSVAISGGTVVR
jgi:hypothetical protein